MTFLVHSRGFEPLTLGAEIRYSIQLNYECVKTVQIYRQRNPFVNSI